MGLWGAFWSLTVALGRSWGFESPLRLAAAGDVGWVYWWVA